MKISSIENLVEDFDGGFDRSDKSVDGARNGEIGWRIQSKIDWGFDEHISWMEDFMKNNGRLHCFDSRYLHWRQDRLKVGLDGARTI